MPTYVDPMWSPAVSAAATQVVRRSVANQVPDHLILELVRELGVS